MESQQTVVLMDYSENYRCVFQDEIHSGYFDQLHVTIHPAMAYYEEDKDGILFKHAIVGISSDTRHDSHLTNEFQAGILNILEKQSGLTDIQSIVEWTDGCSAQYKCKFSVFDYDYDYAKSCIMCSLLFFQQLFTEILRVVILLH